MTYIPSLSPQPVSTGKVLTANSTTTPLASAASFTGTWTDVSEYASITVALKTDQDGSLAVQFSPDGTNADSALPFTITSGINEVHRVTVTRKYFRVVVTNTSASPQTYLRAQSLAGQHAPLTSPLNGQIQRDADATTVRPMDFNLMAAEGLYQNVNVTIKDGSNPDVDTVVGLATPQDLWSVGGAYTGFPKGAPEAGEIVVAGADTGTVYYSYLASSTDTDYTFSSVAITGAGTYPCGHNIWRCNFAYFVASTDVFNVGLITIRNTVTTANVFVTIPIGLSQSSCAAYTVPYGSSVYIDRFTTTLRGSASGSIDGYWYYRPLGESPRLRFPFEGQYGSLYFDDIDYTIKVPQQVDIMPRVVFASANNLVPKVSYRVLKIKG